MTRSLSVTGALAAAALALAAAAPGGAAAQAGASPAARAALAGAPAPLDTAAKRAARPTAGAPVGQDLTIKRETFQYAAEGRRDPFLSLLGTSELRPMVSDLRLAVVLYHPGGDSRAVLRDVSTNEQYKVRTGQTLGRMRVARITPKAVTFTILEFGESRQETLALNDSTSTKKARTP